MNTDDDGTAMIRSGQVLGMKDGWEFDDQVSRQDGHEYKLYLINKCTDDSWSTQ